MWKQEFLRPFEFENDEKDPPPMAQKIYDVDQDSLLCRMKESMNQNGSRAARLKYQNSLSCSQRYLP